MKKKIFHACYNAIWPVIRRVRMLILMPMKSMSCWTVLKNLMIILTMMKSWP